MVPLASGEALVSRKSLDSCACLSANGSIFFLSFFFRYAACGIFVPQPGIEPTSLLLEAQSLNHWTAREVPDGSILMG